MRSPPETRAAANRGGSLRSRLGSRQWGVALTALPVLALAASCSRPGDPEPAPTAQPHIVHMLREDRAATPHPADGGGRAWLVAAESTVPAVAGEHGRWRIDFEAGSHGIAEGGAVYLQVSPFWGWSTPQVVAPEAPGFTSVASTAPGVELVVETVDRQLLRIGISGRPLAAGEILQIDYGAGESGARADRYAETASTFFVAVDGDGDGRRRLLAESPTLPVTAGAPGRLILTLPATARPGDPVRLTVAVLDSAGNAGPEFSGRVELTARGPLELPESVELAAGDDGFAALDLTARREGVVRLLGRAAGGLVAASNPLVVSGGSRIAWGDLHGHSGFSDGTGTPEDYFRYAREVAALDIAALTDHDSWGLEPLALRPDRWAEIERQAERFDSPGRFVALAGYEWTSWVHGHRHVLFFAPGGTLLDSLDPRFEHPRALWAALRGTPALTFAHHSAGGPVATDWRIRPDPELEPVTEIVSVHGSSEAADSPHPIHNPLAGNFVRDVLDSGERLGFVGSGDSHDGHPGLAHVAAPRLGGLAGVMTEHLDRGAVLKALRERRVYATNGPRIVLRTTLDGAAMGSVVAARGEAVLALEVAAVEELSRVDVVRTGEVTSDDECAGQLDCRLERRLEDLAPGEYVYVRVVQQDGGAAWSSPFFIE